MCWPVGAPTLGYMFIGIRDLRHAKGRFGLIAAVIALLTFMVVALSALTAGLQNQSISAVDRLPGKTIVLQSPAGSSAPSLTESSLDAATVDRIVAGASESAELGVTRSRVDHGDAGAAVTVFGADPSLMPAAETGGLPGPDQILLGATQATELGVGVGDEVVVGGRPLEVSGMGPAGDFSHSPVGYVGLDTWRAMSHGEYAGAVILWSDAPEVAGTTALPMSEVISAVPGYSSEHGSLLAIQVMLLAISALVTGAFFAVWTQQRLADLAVVRAMGASRGYLFRDGIGQAGLVLLIGEALGAALALGLIAAIADRLPVALSVSGVLVPVAVMAVLGLVGATLAVRRVTTVDPLVAMAG